MKKIIIFGIGEIAEALTDAIEFEKKFEILAYTVDDKFIKKEKFKNKPIIPINEILKNFEKDKFYFLTAIGFKKLNKDRQRIYEMLKQKGFLFTNFVSSEARLVNARYGENNIIFEFNNLQSNVSMGNNNIIWSGNHIGHHSKIGNNCFITSHVTISGSVVIEDNCFLGVNSTIKDNILIERETIIGAGSLILKNIKKNSILSSGQSELSKISSDKFKM